jgi:hypothetical protein
MPCGALFFPGMDRITTSSTKRAMTLIEVLIMILVTAIAAVLTIRLSVP